MKPFKDTYVMYWLLEFIGESTIICLCKASKKLNEICKSYIKLEDDKRFEVIVNDNEWNNNGLLEKYCKNNDVITIRKMIKLDLYWDFGLWGACRSGNMDIVKLMIEKGANNWNWGLDIACAGGHLDCVKLMIEKGATRCGYGYRCRQTVKEHLLKIK